MKSGRFDNNSLPVRWNAHVEDSALDTVDPVFFRWIDEIVHWALERGLSIIIDFHRYEEMMSDPKGNKEQET